MCGGKSSPKLAQMLRWLVSSLFSSLPPPSPFHARRRNLSRIFDRFQTFKPLESSCSSFGARSSSGNATNEERIGKPRFLTHKLQPPRRVAPAETKTSRMIEENCLTSIVCALTERCPRLRRRRLAMPLDVRVLDSPTVESNA